MPDLEEQLLAAAGDTETQDVEIPAEVEATEAPVETPVETVVEATTEQAQEPQNHFLSWVKDQFGEDLSGKYQNDLEAIKGLLHASKKIGERDEDAQIGRFIRENPSGAFQWLQQQLGMTATQAAQVVEQSNAQTNAQASGAPEFDAEWDQVVELDERGRAIGVKPGNDPSIAMKFNRAMDYARKTQRDLLFNPEKVLQPYLTKAEERAVQKAREQWEQEFQSRYGQMAESNDAQQVLATHKSWMFVGGDPSSRQLTAAGRIYNEAVQEWHQRYPAMSSRDLDQLALNAVRARFPSQPKPTAKPGAPAKTANVQKPAPNQEMTRREGESALDYFTRMDTIYKLIPDE